MKAIQLYVLIALICIVHVAFANTKCKLSVDKAQLKASGSHLRIRGHVSVGNSHCKPTKDDDNDVSTTITLSSKKRFSFRDAKGETHSGKKCTITANWYNTPDKYHHSGKNKEVYVPFRLAHSIDCDKDAKASTKKSKTTTKKKKTTTKKRKTTTKKRKTTTKKKSHKTSSACGEWNDNNDMIAAVGGELYGSYSKKSSVCGKKVLVTNKANGKSVKVTITDACESCDKTHIDLSPAAFAKIGKFDTGVLKVEWHYI
ncbi:barwin-like endoglucanase [Rhizopus microsporus]|uniref:Barwin-like endoglucanase n=1 Tax=Rhizopus microsporus TaxID=58291 RepID=A0A1X0SFZ5_RHIZD|nr:barwin-like endoglucanase [Rhizopus microsporus]